MTMHFEDAYDPNSQWLHTVIHVPKNHKPYYQLYTGGEYQRFMLTSKDYTYYWGAISSDYYDVSLLYNPHKANEYSPIRPINSSDIEHFKQTKLQDYWQYWSNFFAKQLQTTQHDFLYSGDWWLFPLPITSRKYSSYNNYFYYDQNLQVYKNPTFTIHAPNTPSPTLETRNVWRTYEHNLSFHISHDLMADQELLHDIRWDNEIDVLLYHPTHLPNKDDGRVKWWRKKIIENSCPPLLVWYQSHLQGYFLIDGHARLQAYLLENIVPDILVITPVAQKQYPIDLDKRRAILQSLKNNVAYSQTPLTMEQINNALIQAFDDNVRQSAKGTAKPISHLDELWLKDVEQFIGDKRVDQNLLDFMIHDERR